MLSGRLSRAILVIAAAGLGACTPPSVVRVFDGREVIGRYIDERAYALYARGADAEAHGDGASALSLYEAAASADEESPEIWTRVGALRCKTGSFEKARDAFARAFKQAPDYPPAWREMATCALAAGDLPAATIAADRALLLDPDSLETAAAHAAVTERRAGRPAAIRELEALTVRSPEAIAAWRALYELARRSQDQGTLLRAGAALRLRRSEAGDPLDPSAARQGSLTAIDADLARGDLASARRRALRAHVLASEIALRAAALGQVAAARDEAALIAGADPTDASALIALAVAADLARDEPAVDDALRGLLRAPLAPPSRLARLLFAELVDRRAGPEAARAWLTPDAVDPGDPLLARVEERVSAKLYPKGPHR